jgi:hypothetical protein
MSSLLFEGDGPSVAARTLGWGLGIGVVSGAVAGTLVVPGLGTAFGAWYGFLVSLLPTFLGSIAIVASARPGTPPEVFRRRVRWITAAIGVVLVGVGIPFTLLQLDELGTAAVIVGIVVAAGLLVWATDRIAAVAPPAAGERWAEWWPVGGQAILLLVILGWLGWGHVFSPEARQGSGAAALRDGTARELGLDLDRTGSATERCRRGGARQVRAFGSTTAPTGSLAVVSSAARDLAADGYAVTRGISDDRTSRWVYAQKGSTSVEVSLVDRGANVSVVVTAGCPPGPESGSYFPVDGARPPQSSVGLDEHERRSKQFDTPNGELPLLYPVGDEVPGRDLPAGIVSAAVATDPSQVQRGGPCPEPERADRIHVNVADELDPVLALDDRWVVTSRSGERHEAACVSLDHGSDIYQGRTIVLAGDFGGTEDPPVGVEAPDGISTLDPAKRPAYQDAAFEPVEALGTGPRLAMAEVAGEDPTDDDGSGYQPERGWSYPESALTGGECPDETRQVIRLVWTLPVGHVANGSPPHPELTPAAFEVRLGDGTDGTDGATADVLLVDGRGDNDNTVRLCLGSEEEVDAVTVDAGAVVDDRGNPNDETTIRVG